MSQSASLYQGESTSIMSIELQGDRRDPVQETYRVLDMYPNYEVSETGSVRRVGDVFPIYLRRVWEFGILVKYVNIFQNGNRVRCKVNDLVRQSFPGAKL